MIDMHVDKGSVAAKLEGTLTDLAAESAIMINSIFQSLPEDVREDYKQMLMLLTSDSVSPMWNPMRYEGEEKVVVDLSSIL